MGPSALIILTSYDDYQIIIWCDNHSLQISNLRPFLPWNLKTYHLLIVGTSNFGHHILIWCDHHSDQISSLRPFWHPNIFWKHITWQFAHQFKGKCPILTNYHQIPATTAMYWSSTINYQLLSPYTDSVPPSTNHCCFSYTDPVHSFNTS